MKTCFWFHYSWVLYEKPDFQGRSIALEEGGTELTNEWAESGLETEPHNNLPMLIGSIRLAVSVSAHWLNTLTSFTLSCLNIHNHHLPWPSEV